MSNTRSLNVSYRILGQMYGCLKVKGRVVDKRERLARDAVKHSSYRCRNDYGESEGLIASVSLTVSSVSLPRPNNDARHKGV